MTNLRSKMAEQGFESNENYDYIVRCLQSTPGPSIRCLNIRGDAGRHKTAFANALAHSLEAAHVLYHDFTQAEEPFVPAIIKSDDEDVKEDPPIGLFDKIMNDTCAFSEAESTILILDQLQAADFKEHIRLYEFLVEREWHYLDATFYANRQNLSLFLISEEPLYHSLQKNSFKVWVKAASHREQPFAPADFQLDESAADLMGALHQLFQKLMVFPTYSEYKKIIYAIQQSVHTIDDLKATIYGWTEGIDYQHLHSKELANHFQDIMPIIEAFIGITENLELTAADIPDNQ